MGIDTVRLQWLVVLGVGLTVGASVAAAGVIGFVGLIVPHLVRPLVGHKPSAVLLPSALAGALLVVLADSIVRILPSAGELRLGIAMRSEEHTSELQSLMRISSAVFCLNKKTTTR